MKNHFAYHEYNNPVSSLLNKLKALINNGLVLAILAALAASSKAIFVKLIYAETAIAPLDLLTLRLLISLPFFAFLIFYRRPTLHNEKTAQYSSPGSMLLIFWVGFCGYYFASLTDFIGLQTISSSLERMVLFTYPALVVLIEAVWRKQWPARNIWVNILISYFGILVAFGYDFSQADNSNDVITGVGWVLLSGFSFALYYLGANSCIRIFGIRQFVGLAGIAATIITSIHFVLSDSSLILEQLSANVWSNITAIAILCTVLPSLLMAAAIRKIGASITAQIGMFGPAMTMLLAWWILGESLSVIQLAGLSLVVFGISRIRPQ